MQVICLYISVHWANAMLFWMSVVFINIEMNDFLNKFISFDIHLGHIDLTTLKIDKQLLRFLLEEAHNLKTWRYVKGEYLSIHQVFRNDHLLLILLINDLIFIIFTLISKHWLRSLRLVAYQFLKRNGLLCFSNIEKYCKVNYIYIFNSMTMKNVDDLILKMLY